MPTSVKLPRDWEVSEHERVRRWRQACLEKAGLCKEDAAYLAGTQADLHEILDAYAQGCDALFLCRIYADLPQPRTLYVEADLD